MRLVMRSIWKPYSTNKTDQPQNREKTLRKRGTAGGRDFTRREKGAVIGAKKRPRELSPGLMPVNPNL